MVQSVLQHYKLNRVGTYIIIFCLSSRGTNNQYNNIDIFRRQISSTIAYPRK